jgi:hypothetical protein
MKRAKYLRILKLISPLFLSPHEGAAEYYSQKPGLCRGKREPSVRKFGRSNARRRDTERNHLSCLL